MPQLQPPEPARSLPRSGYHHFRSNHRCRSPAARRSRRRSRSWRRRCRLSPPPAAGRPTGAGWPPVPVAPLPRRSPAAAAAVVPPGRAAGAACHGRAAAAGRRCGVPAGSVCRRHCRRAGRRRGQVVAAAGDAADGVVGARGRIGHAGRPSVARQDPVAVAAGGQRRRDLVGRVQRVGAQLARHRGAGAVDDDVQSRRARRAPGSAQVA